MTRTQENTTASGQSASPRPVTRSASPTWSPALTSSAPNQKSRANRTATAAAAAAGLSAHGVTGPRRQAPAGQVVSPANPTDAQRMCGIG